MRDKQDILEATHRNALKSHDPKDISLIHSLHTLEVLIDIRDILNIKLPQLITELHNLRIKD